MKKSRVISISVLALLALIAISIFYTIPEIENDLIRQSKDALLKNGIDFTTVTFSGQQAILKGSVKTREEKQQIEEIILSLTGVSGVSNQIKVLTPIAVIIKVTGESVILNSLKKKSANAGIGIFLTDGDKISTGANGRIELKFLDDNSLLRMRPNSECIINVKSENNTVVKNVILEIGSVLSKIAGSKNVFSVKTITSLAAVKGTAFWSVQELNGATSFFGEEGIVEISNDAGRVLMKAGEMCSVLSKNSRLIVEKIDLKKEFIKIAGDNKISFDQSGYKLNKKHLSFLNKVKLFLEKFPTASLMIQGYTDNIGNAAANLKLSEQRAKAVREYLINSGVDPDILSVKGFGEKNPVATNNTQLGRSKNRRVEFKVGENK